MVATKKLGKSVLVSREPQKIFDDTRRALPRCQPWNGPEKNGPAREACAEAIQSISISNNR
jgi:hypothetical protein